MKKNKFKVTVVLPAYNEKDNIKETIERLVKSLGNDLLEIIVVDDNSPDETWKVVQELHNPVVKLIRRMNEKGLASAIARGVKEAQGNNIVWMDCDLGIPPEIAPKLVEQLNNHDVSICSRYVPGGGDPRPFPRPLLSKCLNLFACILFGSQIKDYTSGVAAIQKNVKDLVLWTNDGFGEYFVEFSYLCIKNKVRIIEIPVQYAIRKGGVSKSDGNVFTLLKYGFQYGFKMIQLRLKGI